MEWESETQADGAAITNEAPMELMGFDARFGGVPVAVEQVIVHSKRTKLTI